MATNTNVPDAAPIATPNITLAIVPSAVSATVVGLTVAKVTPHVKKPQQFNGEDFKRWQQKMVFYLTTLNLSHILKEDCPVTTKENQTPETEAAKEA